MQKPLKPFWAIFNQRRIPYDYLTEQIVAGLLSPQNADRKRYSTEYAKALTEYLIQHPALIQQLRPNEGQFHRDVLTRVLADPKLAPEMRNELARQPHLCAAML